MALDTSVLHMSRALTQWLKPATDDRVVAGSNPSASPRNLAYLGRSASSFIKHRVGAYIRSTVLYVDIISYWSLLYNYGVYDGGGGSKNMFVQ